MKRMMVFFPLLLLAAPVSAQDEAADLGRIAAEERRFHEVLDRVVPAFVFVGNGSAVCISEDGWIVTNHHVAGETGRVWRVRFSGGRSHLADVIGFDPLGDLSLLKVRGDVSGLPWAPLGDSDALQAGQTVFAVGNPFLLGQGSWEPSVAKGIVSALHRYQDWYMDAVQTDARINPGNSGGPLFTLAGKIIGINGRIDIRRFRLRVNTGIGYAVPSNQVRRYLPLLKAGGRVRHGYADGLKVGECGKFEDRYGDTGEYGDGVFIGEVRGGTPAGRAGLDPGDVLFEVAGQRVFNMNRFHGILGSHPPGSRVKVRFRRNGQERETMLLLGDPEQIREWERTFDRFQFGWTLEADDGIRVKSVLEGGPAGKAGVLEGDRILRCAGREVDGFLSLKGILALVTLPRPLEIVVEREGKEVPLTILGAMKVFQAPPMPVMPLPPGEEEK